MPSWWAMLSSTRPRLLSPLGIACSMSTRRWPTRHDDASLNASRPMTRSSMPATSLLQALATSFVAISALIGKHVRSKPFGLLRAFSPSHTAGCRKLYFSDGPLHLRARRRFYLVPRTAVDDG